MTITYQLRYQDRNGRWIHTQNDEQRVRGSAIIKAILDKWKPNKIYYHFRNGGHVNALSIHLHNNFFLKADINNFFYQVSRAKIARSLKKIGFEYGESSSVAYDSTVKNPRTNLGYVIPFGFRQSPLIATLVLQKSSVGRFLGKLEDMKDVTVSVYMDDILISAATQEKLDTIKVALVEVCEASNFALNLRKLVGPAPALEIFNIDIMNGAKSINDERLQQFQSSIQNTSDPNVISGIIGYVKSVDTLQATQLEEAFLTFEEEETVR